MTEGSKSWKVCAAALGKLHIVAFEFQLSHSIAEV